MIQHYIVSIGKSGVRGEYEMRLRGEENKRLIEKSVEIFEEKLFRS